MLARLERCWQGWPAPLAAEARNYSARGRWRSSSAARRLDADLAYVWLLLPQWLAASTGVVPRKEAGRFLRDVLWGQYALFLFVRIHDDLVDHQARSPWLAYVGDRYLVESVAAYSRHADREFWPLFWALVTETLDGIAEADRLQRCARPDRRALLAAYARVAAIFKVGSIAVLQRADRMQLYPAVSTFKDHTAMAGQIVDDLQDLDEDLEAGRRNYVAARLLRAPRLRKEPRDPRAMIAGRLFAGDHVDACLKEADRQFAAAGRALTLAPAQHHIDRQRQYLDRMRASLHARRVSFLVSAVNRQRR
jgi:hypothetical protein